MSRRRPTREQFVATLRSQRTQTTSLYAGAGLIGGVVGAAYIGALHLMQHMLWPDEFGRDASGLVAHGVILVAVGAAVAMLRARLGDPGNVELLVDNIHVLGGAKDVRSLRSLIPISLLCVSAGGALGPEAPLVQTTGSLGSVLAARCGLRRDEARLLTITAMAAAFTVLFGVPLGAAVFALEILHRRGLEYYEALLPAIIGSLCGYATYVVITGLGLEPVWSFPAPSPLRGVDLGWAVACGAIGAVVAGVFAGLTTVCRAVLAPLPQWAQPIAGGLGLAALAAMTPYALTFGEDQLGVVVASRVATTTLVAAAIAKLVASALSLSAGWRGGFIIPLFFVGACLARALHAAAPSTNVVVLTTALMAACNVGVTKTPIGSVLVVTGMAGVALVPTTLIASVVALVLTTRIGVIHTQRQRAAVDPAAAVG